jgi:transcription initiation factor TFIIIB Brf1 subunit/transcription initiation factor TFIIB
MPTTTIKCPNCGSKIRDNPDKHVERPKICNQCGKPYRVEKRFGTYSPKWIKEKLRRQDDRKVARAIATREAAVHGQEISDKMQDEYDRRIYMGEKKKRHN